MSLHAIPVDVALGSHGPEDGTDVLGVPPVVGWRLPGPGVRRERGSSHHMPKCLRISTTATSRFRV